MSSAWLRPVALCHVGLPLSECGMLAHTPKTTNNTGDFMGPFPRDYTRVEPCFPPAQRRLPKKVFTPNLWRGGWGSSTKRPRSGLLSQLRWESGACMASQATSAATGKSRSQLTLTRHAGKTWEMSSCSPGICFTSSMNETRRI